MNKNILIGAGVIVVAGILIFGGKSLSDPNEVPNNAHNSTNITEETNDNVTNAGVELAPDFTLENLAGGMITLSDYIGEKPVILDFWASWCPNCRRDMPKLSGFYEKYKTQVEVIGVNLQEKESTIQKYIDKAEIKFPIALDPRATASRAFGIQYTNVHVLINKDGTINSVIPGDITESQIVALIEAGI